MRNTMKWLVLLVTIHFLVGVAGCGGGGGGSDAVLTSPPDSETSSPDSETSSPDSETSSPDSETSSPDSETSSPDSETSSPDSDDAIAPRISSTTPVHGGDNFALDSAIMVTFSEKMDSETITDNAFSLKDSDSGETVAATVTFDGDRSAVLRPEFYLDEETNYTATVKDSVSDLAGNSLEGDYTWTFTTGLDYATAQLEVDHTFPANNGTDVALNISLVATMSDVIDPTSVNNKNFTLQKAGDSSPVAGSVTNVGTNLILKPETALAESSDYTATLTTGIKDLAGYSIAQEFSWSFSTGSALDDQAPEVVFVDPDGIDNVPVDETIVVTFNEAVMAFKYGLIDGRPVSVSSNDTYKVISMTPTDSLSAGTPYEGKVYVKDMAGNWMESTYTWEFTTNP